MKPVLLNFLFIKESWKKSQKYWTAQLFPTLIINQHIIIISEGLCDTEDWSKEDENSDLLHRIKFNFIEYENINLLFYIAIIFHKITVVFCIFLSNKCSFDEQKELI